MEIFPFGSHLRRIGLVWPTDTPETAETFAHMILSLHDFPPNQSAAASNRRPAGQSDGLDNLFAIVAADRAFPAAVAELDR